MESLKPPIDKLTRRGYANAEIARRLDVSPQKLNDWKHGRLPMPTHKLMILATLADLDPVKLIGEYEIERARKKGRPALAAGVALVCLVLAGGDDGSPWVDEGSRGQAIHYAKRCKAVFRARWTRIAGWLSGLREGLPALALA